LVQVQHKPSKKLFCNKGRLAGVTVKGRQVPPQIAQIEKAIDAAQQMNPAERGLSETAGGE